MEDVSVQAALAAALAGDVPATEKMIATLLNGSTKGSDQIRQYWVPMLRAALALHAGEPAHAITLLQPAEVFAAREYWVWTLLGQAHLAAGQPDQAAAAYQQILSNPGIDPTSPMLPLAHLGLARTYALNHRRTESLAEYDHFFDYWKTADSDLPVTKKARIDFNQLPPTSGQDR
jgi:predicted Zn-dependent protease